MSLDGNCIRLDNVSVCYRIPSERIRTFKEYAIRWMQRKLKLHSFWALHDVSLNVKQGEVYGLIGANGAGKSTLLKLVARVIPPSKGRVQVVGRVAPLLELGAGFHPELSGRENIYLNGTMLGFTRRQLDEKFDRIVDFAELWEFIDAPMRTYSSGMWARLGFSVATDTKPDVLIIDEILGVGDEAFQKKSSKRIIDYKDQGATVLIVSHNSALVEMLCQQAAWLNHGRLVQSGDAKEVVTAYRDSQNISAA